MSRSRASAPAPRFVQHPKRPEWGVGRLIDVYQGLQRVHFADGNVRKFREDVLTPADASLASPELLALVDVPTPPPVRSAHDRVRKVQASKTASAAAPKAR